MRRRITSEIDRLDTEIVRLLQRDGRQPNTEIARKLGVAEATVRKRINRLVRVDGMQVGAWVDPLKLGYQVYTMIDIQVNLAQIDRVAEQLRRLPEIYFLGICTGAYDILAAAVFRSNQHLDEFMTKRLARIRGVHRTSTSSIIRLVKRENPAPRIETPSDRTGKRARSSGKAARRKAVAGDPATSTGAARGPAR